MQRRAVRFFKSGYTRYVIVSDMLGLGWPPLSQRRLNEFCFTKLLTVWHECPSKASFVLIEEYNGTRRNHNMKFRRIGHTTSEYGQSVFHNTISAWNRLAFAEAPSLAVFRSNFL